jgi:hypothetical protein
VIALDACRHSTRWPFGVWPWLKRSAKTHEGVQSGVRRQALQRVELLQFLGDSCCGRIKSLLSGMIAAPQTLSAMPRPKERRRANKVCERLRGQKCRLYLRSLQFTVMTDCIRPQPSTLDGDPVTIAGWTAKTAARWVLEMRALGVKFRLVDLDTYDQA